VTLRNAENTLQARRGEVQPYRLMEAFVPPAMRQLIEGGASALQAAREAEAFVHGGFGVRTRTQSLAQTKRCG
jgi:hypothetical protein